MPAKHLFDIEQDGAILVLRVREQVGTFDDLQVVRVVEDLESRLEQQGCRAVIVDFGKIEYFGSSMLEALRGIWHEVHRRQGGMALCNVSPIGKEILHLSRFDTLWPILETYPAAVAAMQPYCTSPKPAG